MPKRECALAIATESMYLIIRNSIGEHAVKSAQPKPIVKHGESRREKALAPAQ